MSISLSLPPIGTIITQARGVARHPLYKITRLGIATNRRIQKMQSDAPSRAKTILEVGANLLKMVKAIFPLEGDKKELADRVIFCSNIVQLATNSQKAFTRMKQAYDAPTYRAKLTPTALAVFSVVMSCINLLAIHQFFRA